MVKKGVIAAAAMLGLLGGCGESTQVPRTGVVFSMNTVVEYKLYGENSEKAEQALLDMFREFESRVSNFLPESDISRLNSAAGEQAVELSQTAFDVLVRAISLCAVSDGAFDITLSPLERLWNITSDGDIGAEGVSVPTRDEVEALLANVDYRSVLLDPGKRTAKLAKQGQAVDLGGMAKGYAADLARQTLVDNGVSSGYVSIGGNLMIIGKSPGSGLFGYGDRLYKFSLRDPRGGVNDAVATIELTDTTMATSGDYERYFIGEDGVRYHHILDPMTGYPANAGLMSASVISPDGAYADYMSTNLFVRGREYALNNINSLDCGIILIDTDKRIYVSKSLEDAVRPLDGKGYTFEVVQ